MKTRELVYRCRKCSKVFWVEKSNKGFQILNTDIFVKKRKLTCPNCSSWEIEVLNQKTLQRETRCGIFSILFFKKED